MGNICDNYEDESLKNQQIGYMPNSQYFFMVFAILGMIINIVIIVDFILKFRKDEKNKKTGLEQMFCLISIIDLIMCIYWLLSSIIYPTGKDMHEKCTGCICLSLIVIFAENFDLTFLNMIIVQFKKINANPIDGILKTTKNIIKYYLFSIGVGLSAMFLASGSYIIGASPMLTCFIRGHHERDTITRQIFFYLYQLLPIALMSYGVYQIIKVTQTKMFENDIEMQKVFKRQMIYIGVYFALNFPVTILFILTVFIDIPQSTSGQIISFITTVTKSITPLVVACMRIYQGLVRIEWMHNIKDNWNRKSDLSMEANEQLNPSEEDIDHGLTFRISNTFKDLEDKAMNTFMRNIYAGIAYSIKKAIKYEGCESTKISECQQEEIYKITLDNFDIQDDLVNEAGYLEVQINDYAPSIFAYLRHLDGIENGIMYQSFLPMKNRTGLSKSQGKSGTFFISTDDNEFMIKTLKVEEFEMIRNIFIKKYTDYLKKNQQSLICRIYGMYKIIMPHGDVMHIIVMRNLIGNFNDSILCKFDLKGSTSGRKAKINDDNIDKVIMKDLNFEEIEQVVYVNEANLTKIRQITKNDSSLFEELQLMDYSLFVVKISINKELQAVLNDPNSDYAINWHPEMKSLKNYLFPSLQIGQCYIIAIIDYFQVYNFSKLLETNIKSFITGQIRNSNISCVSPGLYAKRFVEFVNHVTTKVDLAPIDNNDNNNDNN